MHKRTVLFVDPPAFCTTVEGLVAPALRERPVAVAAPGADRATILALSAEARFAGITRGMAVSKAKKMCPDLILRPPNPRLYARASRALHEILNRYAPIVEPKGYGHAFLDLTGTGRLFGAPIDVAALIDREARQRLGLPLAVGVAQNKLVSEAASEVVKGEERAGGQSGRRAGDLSLLDVPVGDEEVFLAPHEVDLLPDLDEKIRARLDDYQLERIGEIQAIDDADLFSVFGPPGRTLGAHARGIDPRPVLPPAVKAEFRAVHTLGNDSNDLGLLHRVLRHLTERLGTRLRARKLVARRLTLHLAYTDYTTAKRSVILPLAALDAELLQAASQALTLALTRTVALRAIGLTVDRILELNTQLELWDTATRSPFPVPRDVGQTLAHSANTTVDRRILLHDGPQRGTGNGERGTQLQTAIDRIRTRWGTRGIRLGA